MICLLTVPSDRIADRTLDYIATVHCSKSYSSGGSQWNFLSFESDLLFDVNQIVLCRVCAESPMTKDQESIAAGNNYGCWQFETTEWYNPERMCTSRIIKHQFANMS
jgi:hypothetical protein